MQDFQKALDGGGWEGFMRIGINALFRWKPTGVANYICNLVYHLTRIDRKNEYVVLTTSENRSYFPIQQNNFKLFHCPLNSEGPIYRRLWEQVYLPKLTRSYDIDLLHCPMNVLPMFSRCITVVTLIDTQYFQNPDHFSILRRNYLKFMMRKSFDKANGIITISEAVKKEINECLGRQDDKEIRVIHLGLNPSFRVIQDDRMVAAIKRKYGILGKYLLFTGYPHYRKNLPRLIAAFKRVLDLVPEQYTLVIAGEMGTDDSDIENVEEAIDRHRVRDKVLFVGYVPGNCVQGEKEELSMALLMNGAELLVYPSLYEGFGLPVLEAMACATPVLASDIPVFREVAGEAAIFVNPYKIEDIANKIFQGLTDNLLRSRIVSEGIERVKRFSWETNAQKTLEYYEELFDRARRRKNG